MPNKLKIEAKDVSEAINVGLKKLGLRRDQVEVSILQHPKKGFLGIGAKNAVVELRPKRWSTADLDEQIYMDLPKRKAGRGGRRDNRSFGRGRGNNRRPMRRRTEDLEVRIPRMQRAPKANEPQLLPCDEIRNAIIPDIIKGPMEEAKEHLRQVLERMGVKVENLNAWWDEKQQRILLTFDCDHPAIVIGKEGKTLEAIQYLSTLALSRHFDKPISVITDTQNYWRKAEDKLNAEIEKGIALIKSGHSVFRFRPMPAQLRRYIHRALEGNEFVNTASEGEGKWRKVTFRPTEKVTELLNANKAPADFIPGVIEEDTSSNEETVTTQELHNTIVESQETPITEGVTETAVVETIASVQETAPVEQSVGTEPITVIQNTTEQPVVQATVAPEQPTTEQTVMLTQQVEKTQTDCGPLFANVENTENK